MPDPLVTITIPREMADKLYDLLGETPHDAEHAWTFAVSVPLADALGYHVPAWVREKAAIDS